MENELVKCEICGFEAQRIYGRHLKSHGLTSKEYKNMYPDALLYAECDYKNTSKNSGKHMKTEKYKKMFSEKIKGEKNPNHKSNTTIEKRQECSPFSKGFKNYTDDNERTAFIKNVCDNKSYQVRLDYWINKGYSEDEAKQKLKERQTTFTLDICIEKYGKEKGEEIYKNRQQRWLKSLIENGNLKCGYSMISQELFFLLLDKYEIDKRNKIYFATKNKEYFICKGKEEFFQYDFVDLENKKIIEYNGDQYHANPKLYEATDHPHPFRKQITAQEIWDKDERKKIVANEEGFDVLTIWDSEYKKNKYMILDKCLNFLKK
ncbi:endonuclease domain-containing protein [Candidatus Dojkabacteria bacterium]|jgi:hypothetical protein|nr:endonuclease domain-containing protein [Candidatus Dojkabacteria bacterium]